MSAAASHTHGIRSIFDGIVARWRHHRDAMASLREIEALDPAFADALAGEAGLSVAELKDVIRQGAGADRLMQRMMAVHGIDARTVEHDAPGLMRDIAVLCSRCQAKGRCAQELEAGTARENAHLFCPNAETFETFGIA
jgi:hypothetical protein